MCGDVWCGDVVELLQSNSLDLDRDALGQLVHGDAGPRRLVREPFLVLAVHLGEVGHVG